MEKITVKDFRGEDIIVSDFYKKYHPQITDILENAAVKVVTKMCNFYVKFESPKSNKYSSVQTNENPGKNDSVTNFFADQIDTTGMYTDIQNFTNTLPGVTYYPNEYKINEFK